MEQLLQTGALLCTAAALVCGALALLVTRKFAMALAVLLDLLLAAGLLRLALPPTPQRLLTAASLVVVRRLAGVGLRDRSTAPPPAGPSTRPPA